MEQRPSDSTSAAARTSDSDIDTACYDTNSGNASDTDTAYSGNTSDSDTPNCIAKNISSNSVLGDAFRSGGLATTSKCLAGSDDGGNGGSGNQSSILGLHHTPPSKLSLSPSFLSSRYLTYTPEFQEKIKVLEWKLVSCVQEFYRQGFPLDIRNLVKVANDVAELSNLKEVALEPTWLMNVLKSSGKIPNLLPYSQDLENSKDQSVYTPKTRDQFYDALENWFNRWVP